MNSIHNEIVTWSHSFQNSGNLQPWERGRTLQLICLWDDEDTTQQSPTNQNGNQNQNQNQRAISPKLLNRIKRDIIDLPFQQSEEHHIRRLNIEENNKIDDWDKSEVREMMQYSIVIIFIVCIFYHHLLKNFHK